MGLLHDNMVLEMKFRGYSDTTIQMYTKCIYDFAHHHRKSPLSISQIEVRDYFYYLVKNSVSSIRLHIIYSAIKVFYKIHGQPHYIDFIPHPRPKYKLPEVLDESEVQSILSLARNLRYKLLYTLIYSSGLRISEALNLKLPDIDYNRKQIHIRSSKNGHDRYSILSEKAIYLLKFYINRYTPMTYLFFVLRDKSRKMPKRQCQQVFKDLVKAANITKNVHVHTLRHSFATHLLEHNTNIFYIMKLLGHSSIQSTMTYLHLQKFDSLDVHSPLDLSSITLSDLGYSAKQPTLCIA
jgi:integrase/recombinase XerD